ncbi:MAG: DUF502 domain-containing protein [Pseudolabrys sp.]|nr:DUF502 domain-containing protein [Pseudolabrys sp.]
MADTDRQTGTRATADTPAAASHTGVAGRIRNYFLTGLVVAGPLAITAWLIGSIITWVDDLVRPLIPPAYRPESYMPWPVPGTGLIIAFVALTLLGFLTANLVGRTLVGWGEALLGRMPIVRPIYRTMKQIFETLFSKTGSSFRKVALVEFPAPGMWSIVFLSQPPSGEVAGKLPQGDHVSVFMPCTPNPTTGFFFFVRRDELVELDISVEHAMTLLISAGMVQPDAGEPAQKKLAALAATARASQAARDSRAPESVA